MRQKLLLVLFFCFALVITTYAQERTVKGKVTDSETGEGLPGVNVIVKGTSRGMVTDIDGSYQINVPAGAILVFQSLGMKPVEVVVGNQAVISIAMDKETTELGEVVITGYGSELKKEVTGSITKVSGEDIARVPVSNLQQALQGQASGVFVTSTSGTPGGSIQVRVRGASSINASNEPLYIIDGVPVATGNLTQNAFGGQQQSVLNSLNPNDIESISILKDASVTAIYGARAANGVVLITTKKGKAGKTRIDIDYFRGVSQATNRYDLASAALYVETRTAAGGTLPPAVTNWDGETNVDLQDVVFRNAALNQIQMSISGGTDKTQFYLSGNFRDEEAIFIGGRSTRYTARLNLDHRLTDKLTFSARASVGTELNNRFNNDNNIFGIISTALLSPGTIPIRNPETGEFNDILPGFGTNPVRATEQIRNDINTLKVVGNISLNYEVIKGLNLIGDFSYDLNELTEDVYQPVTTAQGRGSNGSGSFAFRRFGTWTFEPRANYRYTFNDVHNVSATLGATLLQTQDFFSNVSGTGFAKPELSYLTSAAEITGGTALKTFYSFNSIFGRVGYSYKEKYVFNASVRRDGSSRFGPGNRFGNFWSVSGAWNFADEAFMDNISWLEIGKLRVGYGVIGNDGIGNFQYTGFFAAGNYVGQPAFQRGGIENPTLKWEETATLDVGLELSLFKGRIDFTTTYFSKVTTDLLYPLTLPRTTGFASVTSNFGEISNKGWEFELGATVLELGGFRWNTKMNVTLIENTVVDIIDDAPQPRGFASAIIEGEPIGAFFGLEWLGVNPATGQSEFLDVDGDGQITGNDQTVIGDAFADVFGGITNTLTYKGITLDFFFQFVTGVDIYNSTMQFLMDPRSNFQDHNDIQFAWRNPGDITFVPRTDGARTEFTNDNSRWLDNGDYLRLKTLTLAYDLPTQLVGKTKFLRSARVYFTGFNLLTFTKYRGIDPEISTFGFTDVAAGTEFLTVPQPRSFVFGVNIGL